jgi:twitching motility protein PilT
MAILEILKSTMRTREYLEKGDSEGRSLLDAMKDGELDGMQHFDGELEKMVRAGTISKKIAYAYATNPGNLAVQLVDAQEVDEPGSDASVITQGFQ